MFEAPRQAAIFLRIRTSHSSLHSDALRLGHHGFVELTARPVGWAEALALGGGWELTAHCLPLWLLSLPRTAVGGRRQPKCSEGVSEPGQAVCTEGTWVPQTRKRLVFPTCGDGHASDLSG